ncbi:MAG: glycosyltransferase [Candidatus Coatesbacteria bacterium]|nr:glycosyltransferase [Candidatus Coatesbacteria bacterium]
MKKILIISVGAGGGHKAASEALKKQGEMLYKDSEFRHFDILDFATPLFKKTYPGTYILMAKHLPELWGYFYDQTEKNPPSKIEEEIHDWIGSMNTLKASKEIEKFSPDAIIATHFFPVHMITRLKEKNKIKVPLYCVVTDHDVHRYWVDNLIDKYFVSNEEVAYILSDKKVSNSRIRVTGIPIHPKYLSLPTKEEARRQLGLNPEDKVVLISSGGEGTGNIVIASEQCFKVNPGIKVIAVAGNNHKTLSALEKLAKIYPNLMPVGFARNMEILMRSCDVMIAKSGGLTTSEALAVGIPIIVVSPIPGQEERNATFLLESGAGIKAYNPSSIAYKLKSLIENPSRLSDMKNAAINASKPFAARDIIDDVMK